MCIGIHANYVKFERHEWPYPPCINSLLIYKMPYPSYRFDDAKLLQPGNPVSYTDHTQLLHLVITLRILSMFLYDYVMIFLL